MIYDYGIVGAGISGCICAYELEKRGKRCIIFEKNKGPGEKICGGGVSYKALEKLENIGIQTNKLFSPLTKSIIGHQIYADNRIKTKMYKMGRVSLGTQRILLDQYLLECAVEKGAIIKYGVEVNNIEENGKKIGIEDYYVNKIVWASGARTPYGNSINGQSIGIAGQVMARSCLSDEIFHYWYFENNVDNKYFWAFPIGENLWNIGIWSRYPYKSMKLDYNRCLENIFLKTVIGEWRYYRSPKGEYLGHIDQRKAASQYMNGIGDFGGNCNPVNGGGIIGAIESAIQFADSN